MLMTPSVTLTSSSIALCYIHVYYVAGLNIYMNKLHGFLFTPLVDYFGPRVSKGTGKIHVICTLILIYPSNIFAVTN
jgi:hypothetical protein